ncbi:hypothetical protein M8C21_004527 [Ambrosia artemisiifolia]|uniref:Uncharacterized protein n=1 Tax=Ambrosia artemisiifolia TaxID=4212 RepID=A0AAD5CJU3_AMBAR|nr:hypothetical protein M8C21_004527 [Ambrosia artemisiifolia]
MQFQFAGFLITKNSPFNQSSGLHDVIVYLGLCDYSGAELGFMATNSLALVNKIGWDTYHMRCRNKVMKQVLPKMFNRSMRMKLTVLSLMVNPFHSQGTIPVELQAVGPHGSI